MKLTKLAEEIRADAIVVGSPSTGSGHWRFDLCATGEGLSAWFPRRRAGAAARSRLDAVDAAFVDQVRDGDWAGEM